MIAESTLPMTAGRRRTAARVVALAAATVFGLISAYTLRFDPAANSGDFLPIFMMYVHRLQRAPLDLHGWVSPAYPVGYNFLILWLGKIFGFIRAAKLLSVVAATFLFLPVFAITREMFDEDVAAAAVLLLAVNRQMYRFAHWEGPDMPAVSLQLLAIWMTIRAARGSRAAAAIGGAALGAAFLMRYQTALVIVVAAGFLVAVLRSQPRLALRQVSFLLGAAALVAAPQFFANLAVEGRLVPRFPLIGARRAIALGSGDVRTWWLANGSVFENAAAETMPSRGEMARFAFRQVISDLFTLPLLPPLIGSLAWGGLVVALFSRVWRRSPAVMFVGAMAIAWVGGMSWYLFHVRGMLLLVPLLTMFAAFLVWTAVRDASDAAIWRTAAPAAVLGVIVLATAWLTVRPQFWPSNYDRTAVDVTAALRQAGMKDTAEVASVTSGTLENSSNPSADYYPVVGWDLAREHVSTWASLQTFVCDHHFHYIVADSGGDEILFPSIGLFDPSRVPSSIQEFYRQKEPQRVVAFRVLPGACDVAGASRSQPVRE